MLKGKLLPWVLHKLVATSGYPKPPKSLTKKVNGFLAHLNNSRNHMYSFVSKRTIIGSNQCFPRLTQTDFIQIKCINRSLHNQVRQFLQIKSDAFRDVDYNMLKSLLEAYEVQFETRALGRKINFVGSLSRVF